MTIGLRRLAYGLSFTSLNTRLPVRLGIEMVKQHGPRQNPVHLAVERWIDSVVSSGLLSGDEERETLMGQVSKKFTIYEPMVLLPAGSFIDARQQPLWITVLGRADADTRSRLWSNILQEVSKQKKRNYTHLAVTEGIPLHDRDTGKENLLRSPTGLRILYGDFGPSTIPSLPAWSEEFEKAFWASTKQNGIYQTWAPRWTMFSRGNVTEKARLLRFPPAPRKGHTWAVDLYAGIGYFVFSYAKLGMRVLCWEINPWSVEGLRRGAEANGWSIRVVQGSDLDAKTTDLVAGGEDIIVFLESNEAAGGRLQELRDAQMAAPIEHVNCGLLPTSRPTWEAAWLMTQDSSNAWLHLHDNVGVNEVKARQHTIQDLMDRLSTEEASGTRTAKVDHVEFVKTFAPGVWHCVFDVQITAEPDPS